MKLMHLVTAKMTMCMLLTVLFCYTVHLIKGRVLVTRLEVTQLEVTQLKVT